MRLKLRKIGPLLGLAASLTVAIPPSSAQAQERTSKSLLKQQRMQQTRKSPTEDKKWSGSLGIILQGKRFDSAKTQKSQSVFTLAANLNYLPTPTVRFNLAPEFSYINGYVQTDAQTDASKSTWSVQNAGVDFLPNKYLTASLGALDQNSAHADILFDAIAFPAAKASVNTQPDADFVAGMQAETAIVTSTSLSTEKTASEKTPTFQSSGLILKKQNGVLEGTLKAYVYEFNDLPSSVAASSANVGNSTTQIGTNPKAFVYEYRGYLAHGWIKANLNKSWALNLTSSWVKNNEAPEGYNQGTVTKFFIDADVSDSLRISPYYTFFRMEPDATVASLNDGRYNTNRVGYLTGLAFNYQKSVKVTLQGGERDVVYVNSAQQRERTWALRLETVNVTF